MPAREAQKSCPDQTSVSNPRSTLKKNYHTTSSHLTTFSQQTQHTFLSQEHFSKHISLDFPKKLRKKPLKFVTRSIVPHFKLVLDVDGNL